MTKLALIQALAPIAKVLIEKLFDLLKGDSDKYAKDGNTDEFLKNIQDKMPEIKEIFKQEGLDFKTTGDLDHSSDVQALIDKLNELKDNTSNPTSIKQIETLVNSLETAKADLLARENAGTSTGEADFTIETPQLVPTSGILYASNPSSPSAWI
jgi:phosphopantetheine adenylyltransferase